MPGLDIKIIFNQFLVLNVDRKKENKAHWPAIAPLKRNQTGDSLILSDEQLMPSVTCLYVNQAY